MNELPPVPRRNGPWLVTGTRQIHRTPWVRIREDQIVWPGGLENGWTVIEMPPAVGVVAIDESRQVYLVGQHRYAVDRFEWEIPEGCIDPGEEPLDAARRELKEETGFTANRWTPLGATHPHNGSCDVTYHMFLAQDLTAGPTSHEATELLTPRTISFDQLVDDCLTGACMDALTVIATFRALHDLQKSNEWR